LIPRSVIKKLKKVRKAIKDNENVKVNESKEGGKKIKEKIGETIDLWPSHYPNSPYLFL
jgi:uncharacterized protein Veg